MTHQERALSALQTLRGALRDLEDETAGGGPHTLTTVTVYTLRTLEQALTWALDEVGALDDELSSAERQLDDSRAHVEELLTENDALRDTNDMLHTDNAALMDEVGALEEEVRFYSDELYRLESERESSAEYLDAPHFVG